MFGFLIAFMGGLATAALWTKNIIPGVWGYLLGTAIGVGFWYWGASLLYTDFDTRWIYLNAREIAAGISILGFISLWVGVPLLHGLGSAAGIVGKLALFIAVPVGILWWFASTYETTADPAVRDTVEAILTLIVIIGALVLAAQYKFKTKKSGGGGGGGGGGHH